MAQICSSNEASKHRPLGRANKKQNICQLNKAISKKPSDFTDIKDKLVGSRKLASCLKF